MGKVVLILFGIALLARLRYRRNTRITGRISTWFLLFVGALLLLVSPWDLALGATGAITVSARLLVAFLLLGYLFLDIRRALLWKPKNAASRPQH